MRISLLTSSRADYGIYLPLLKKLKEDSFFELNIIAFGTHISKEFGYTIDCILEDGFDVAYQIDTVIGDSAKEISQSMALTMKEFSEIWEKEIDSTDLIICLGDRYEMFAAVSASIPFNIPVAHIHGGETTLGAIDNTFRHSLTLMSNYHFTSAEIHSEKVKTLIVESENIFNVGSLSLDNLDGFEFMSVDEFKSVFNIDLSIPTILVTFHPETVSFEKNIDYSKTICDVFKEFKEFQILITLPNADTMGSVIREDFLNLTNETINIFAVENLGLKGYFSAMKHCKFMLGNTSSGIIEAASFGKYVINLGDRQKGRSTGENLIASQIDRDIILNKVEEVSLLGDYKGENIYKGDKLASSQIIDVLKSIT